MNKQGGKYCRSVEYDGVNTAHLLEEHHETSDGGTPEHWPGREQRADLGELQSERAVEQSGELFGSRFTLEDRIGLDFQILKPDQFAVCVHVPDVGKGAKGFLIASLLQEPSGTIWNKEGSDGEADCRDCLEGELRDISFATPENVCVQEVAMRRCWCLRCSWFRNRSSRKTGCLWSRRAAKCRPLHHGLRLNLFPNSNENHGRVDSSGGKNSSNDAHNSTAKDRPTSGETVAAVTVDEGSYPSSKTEHARRSARNT